MSDVIRLVQGDTLPTLYVSLIDQSTGLPVDLSTVTSIIMRYKAVGALVLTDTLTGTPIAGRVNPDGSITTAGYTTPGSGGRFSVSWNPTTLAVAGQFRGEVALIFATGLVQTAYETLRFLVRPLN